jgi:hypothetical protein
MTNTRKPEPPVTKSAYEVLNEFIQNEGIVLALSKPQISFTDSNQIIINSPNIMAFYKTDVPKETQ